jgi:FkbM family methyltransferase
VSRIASINPQRADRMSVGLGLARLARHVTGRFTFRKRLPAEFGAARLHVTTRSDVRLLAPGFSRTATDLFQVARAHIKAGDCVWDIGSNVGIFSVCAAWKAGPRGKVFALEADPCYADLLYRSARSLSERYASVTTLCAAVADRFSILELAIPRRGHSRNHLRIVSGMDDQETEAVKQVVSVTCDFLLARWPRPDFVKIDIEGAELLFLAGAGQMLSTARPGLYLEVSPANCDEITDLLLSHRYVLSRVAADGTATRVNRCEFNTLAQPIEQVESAASVQVIGS